MSKFNDSTDRLTDEDRQKLKELRDKTERLCKKNRKFMADVHEDLFKRMVRAVVMAEDLTNTLDFIDRFRLKLIPSCGGETAYEMSIDGQPRYMGYIQDEWGTGDQMFVRATMRIVNVSELTEVRIPDEF
jgi:hypothetical protein